MLSILTENWLKFSAGTNSVFLDICFATVTSSIWLFLILNQSIPLSTAALFYHSDLLFLQFLRYAEVSPIVYATIEARFKTCYNLHCGQQEQE